MRFSLRSLVGAVRRNPVTALAVAAALAVAVYFLVAVARREGLASDADIPGWKYAGFLGECNYYTTGNGKCKSWTKSTGAYGSSWKPPFAAYHCAQNRNSYKGAADACIRKLDGVVDGSNKLADPIMGYQNDGFDGDTFNFDEKGSSGNFRDHDWNDKMSAIRLPPGRRITLYEDDNQGGARLVITANQSSSKDVKLTHCSKSTGTCGPDRVLSRSQWWNDRASSWSIP